MKEKKKGNKFCKRKERKGVYSRSDEKLYGVATYSS